MGKKLFWFVVGIAIAAVVILKGREFYERFTPKGVAEHIAKTQQGASAWLGDFFNNLMETMTEREAELREATGLDD